MILIHLGKKKDESVEEDCVPRIQEKIIVVIDEGMGQRESLKICIPVFNNGPGKRVSS